MKRMRLLVSLLAVLSLFAAACGSDGDEAASTDSGTDSTETTDDDGEPHVRLQSSNGRDVTVSFPELQSLSELAENFDGLVLDGEIVAFNAEGQPSFNALQQRIHVSDPADAARRAAHTPVMFVAFDLLHLNGHDTMALPLANRRTLLEQIV